VRVFRSVASFGLWQIDFAKVKDDLAQFRLFNFLAARRWNGAANRYNESGGAADGQSCARI
jgi:hypothetical protein